MNGELVINDRSPASVNGAILEEYDALTDENPYVFDSASAQPWNDKAQSITSLRFGSEVAPTSMAYWLADTNLSSINWGKCNTENLTSLRTAFARTKLSEVVLPPMPALTNLRFAFSEVEPLTRADFSQVGANGITNCNSVFKGSYALEEVDLSGLAGTVEDSAFMFGNMTATAPNMGVRTIYATEELNFADASASNNMFRSCVDLVGGAGTVYDESKRDKAYAHIDGGVSNPGYFTDKNAPVHENLYHGASPLTVTPANNPVEVCDLAEGNKYQIIVHNQNGTEYMMYTLLVEGQEKTYGCGGNFTADFTNSNRVVIKTMVNQMAIYAIRENNKLILEFVTRDATLVKSDLYNIEVYEM